MELVKKQGGFLTLFKKRNFLYLWLAQLISMTIFNAMNYASVIMISDITGNSATFVALAIICFSLPAAFLGAPAGVFVDRLDKHRVLWGSNGLRAIVTFVFTIVLLVNKALLLPIYLMIFLISIISQFFTPAEGSAIPRLVDEDELMPALSLFNITFMLSQAIGYIFLGPLALQFLPTITLAGFVIEPAILLLSIIGVLYLVSAGLIFLIPTASLKQQKRTTKTGHVTTETLNIMSNVWGEMLQGWRFVRQRKQLFLAVVQLSFAGIFLFIILELAVPIVTKLLLLPSNAMVFIFAPAGIGLVAGSVIMPRITGRLGKTRTIFIGIIALTMVTVFLPLSTLIAQILQPVGWNTNPLLLGFIMLLMLAAGFALDFVNIPAQTAMQELTPDWIKGRVIALQLALYSACSIPVILFIGVITDSLGVDLVLYMLAVCEIAFGIWGIYYMRKHALHGITPTIEKKQDELEPDTIGPRSTH